MNAKESTQAAAESHERVPSLLLQRYKDEVKQALVERFAYDNVMRTPRVEKVVLNMGVGEAINDKRQLEAAVEQMKLIACQQPVITLAKKSVAGFKIRELMPIGCKVTLRGHQMWSFLDRLVHITIPRIRDFRGLSPRSFDGHGNFAFGIKEQIVFPEIDFDKVDKLRGLDVIVTTSARTNEEGFELLKGLGFPFITR